MAIAPHEIYLVATVAHSLMKTFSITYMMDLISKECGGVDKHRFCCQRPGSYERSPLMRRASWISLGMIVTRLAWMAARFVSSKSPTRYASADS